MPIVFFFIISGVNLFPSPSLSFFAVVIISIHFIFVSLLLCTFL